MPTFDTAARFTKDLQKLTKQQIEQYRAALPEFIKGTRTRTFHPRLRVKRVQGAKGVWEMTWAPDGRATFEWGEEKSPGDPHIFWRRIGTHDVFKSP